MTPFSLAIPWPFVLLALQWGAMASFRRVDPGRAGPNALGILVPPGPRTLIIVRPRALEWDLVLVPAGTVALRNPASWELDRAAAATRVQDLRRALEEWACGGPGRIASVASPDDFGCQLWVEVGTLALAVCRRVPGQPYQLVHFAGREEAHSAARRLTAALCPAADASQELYINTRNFSP
jgi:hypothetical protein